MAKLIGIIPARHGSKGVKNKNFKEFTHGKSLVDLAIDFCETLNIDDYYLSTDFDEFFSENTTVKLHARNKHSADDHATDFDVLKNLYEDKIISSQDMIAWIRPTSPLRCNVEFNDSLHKLSGEFHSLRSIKAVKMHPYWMKTIDGNELKPFTDDGDDTTHPQRQSLPPVFEVSSEFEIISVKAALEQHVFLPKRQTHYLTEKYPKIDIDTPSDFALAQFAYNTFIIDNHHPSQKDM